MDDEPHFNWIYTFYRKAWKVLGWNYPKSVAGSSTILLNPKEKCFYVDTTRTK